MPLHTLLASLPQPGASADAHFFAVVFLCALLSGAVCLLLGVLGGWVHWNYLAGRTIASLEAANADLRHRLTHFESASSESASS